MSSEGTVNARKATEPKFKTAPPPPPKKQNPFAFVAIAFFVLALGGGAFFALKGGKKDPVKPVINPVANRPIDPVPAAPKTYKVSIKTSAPESAEVLEDGILVGTTPLNREWKADQVYSLTLQATGYKPIERKFKAQNDGQLFELKLEPVAQTPTPVTNTGPGRPKKPKSSGVEAFE